MKSAKFSAKLVANFRRSLAGGFRASSAGENRQKHFPPKLHRKFHHQTSLRGSGLFDLGAGTCWRIFATPGPYHRGQNYYKKTLYKKNVLAQLIL